MKYLKELYETFEEQPLKILYTGLVMWILLPILIFGIRGIFQAAFYNVLDLKSITSLFLNAIIPWWVSIIMNFGKFVLQYLFSFIVTLILVHHEKFEPLNPSLKHFKSLLKI